jgi:hypothetical protein
MARLWQRVSDNTNTPTDPSGIRPGLELISPQQADGYQKTYENLSQAVTPECFDRGFSQSFVWIPDRSLRE